MLLTLQGPYVAVQAVDVFSTRRVYRAHIAERRLFTLMTVAINIE